MLASACAERPVDDPRVLIGTRRRRHATWLASAIRYAGWAAKVAKAPVAHLFQAIRIQRCRVFLALILTLAYRTPLKPGLRRQLRTESRSRRTRSRTTPFHRHRHARRETSPLRSRTTPLGCRTPERRTIDIDLTRSQPWTTSLVTLSRATAHYLAAGCD